jgi:transcriptional regulator with XRE-family HTH domain
VLTLQRQSAAPLIHALVMDQTTRRTVARNVKRFRKLANLTQIELGVKSEVGQTTVSSVEREDEKSPTLSTLDSLAAAFGIPTWTLLIDTDQMSKDQLKALDAVVRHYAKLPANGQTQIDRVAEAETRYAKAG